MDLLDDLRETDKAEFKRIANKLISQCFICRDISKKDYRFLTRYKELFNEYFSVLGYRVEVNEDYGVCQLVNFEGHNRKLFNLNETIVLLILRILYDEKKREISLVNDVVVTPGEIQDRYQAIRNGKNITKTDLRNALATFKKYNIVNYGKMEVGSLFNLTDENTPIIVLDSIAMAVPVQDIKQVYNLIETNYKQEPPVEATLRKTS